MPAFEAALKYGVAGETAIARWLRARGNAVMPVYEKIVDTGKGPQIYLMDIELIAPDFLTFKGGQALWIEAKHKTAFAWNRQRSLWVTGIDKRHYEHYLRVAEESGWPVWLLFLHEGGQAKDSPATSPSGLYGGNLAYLSQNINHTSDKWGRHGMVYWAERTLKKLADLQTVYSGAAQ